MKNVKSRFLIVIALCVSMLAGIGIATFFGMGGKKVYASDTDYFMAVEKYSLPTVDGKPNIEEIVNNYNKENELHKIQTMFLYDPKTGDFEKDDDKIINYIKTNDDNSVIFDGTGKPEITLENITNVFLSYNKAGDGIRYQNIITFLRNNKYNNSISYLSQTLQTNGLDVSESEIKNIAMLNNAQIKDNFADYIIMSFMPSNMAIDGFDWQDNSARFQTLGASATLNGATIQAQNGFQDFTSTHKYFARITNLSNITANDGTQVAHYDAQGHYNFEFSFTNASGATTAQKPKMDFYVVDQNYYINANNTDYGTNAEINISNRIEPKLWNVEDVVLRDADETNTLNRNKKEYAYFDYNNAGTTNYDGSSSATTEKINYPTVTYDPTRYTLAYYFVDRSQDSGNLEIVTSSLEYRKVSDGQYDLFVVLSNGNEYKATKTENTDITLQNGYYSNYSVDIRFEDLGSYMLDFDFALFKIDANNQIKNFLPQGETKSDATATLTRTDNWDRIREDNYKLIGTDNLTIYGYQLFYSDYVNLGDLELKNIEKGYYADVTNANISIANDISVSSDKKTMIEGLDLDQIAQYAKLPSTNQPPLSLRYGANQTLLSAYFKRFTKDDDGNYTVLAETIKIDNMTKLATTGIQSKDNGYYQLFVTYKLNSWKNSESLNAKTQIFAFVVNYTTPEIEFSTYDTEICFDLANSEQIVDWTIPSGIENKLTITYRGTKFSRQNTDISDAKNLTFVGADGKKTITFASDYASATYTYQTQTYASLDREFENATTLQYDNVKYTLDKALSTDFEKYFASQSNKTICMTFDGHTWTGRLINTTNASLTAELVAKDGENTIIIQLVDSLNLSDCKTIKYDNKLFSRSDTSTNIFSNDVNNIVIDTANGKFSIEVQNSSYTCSYTQSGSIITLQNSATASQNKTITLDATTIADSTTILLDGNTYAKQGSDFVFEDVPNKSKTIVSFDELTILATIKTLSTKSCNYVESLTAVSGDGITTINICDGKATFKNQQAEYQAEYVNQTTAKYGNLAFEIDKQNKKLVIDKTLGECSFGQTKFNGYGFTNKNVLIDWSKSLESVSPFDIAPTVSVGGNVLDNDQTGGKYRLFVSQDSFKKFDIKIEWGPTNENRSNKQFALTIDKTSILDYVTKFDSNGSVIQNDVTAISSETFRVEYGPKASGADITMSYTFLPIEFGGENGVLTAENNAITNGTIVQSILSSNSYYPVDTTTKQYNYMPSANGIFVLNFADSAGGTATQLIVRDKTSPTLLYRLADEEGSFAGVDWQILTNTECTTRTDVELNRGSYKAILIDTSIVGDLGIKSDNNVKVAIDGGKTYLLVKMNSILIGGQGISVVYDQTHKIVAGKHNENITSSIYSVDALENASGIGKITVSFDNADLKASFSGDLPNSSRKLGTEANAFEGVTSTTPNILYSGQYSTRQYMTIGFNTVAKNYVVSKVTYQYYPFALDTFADSNANYPYAQNPTATGVLFDYTIDNSANGETSDNSFVSKSINLESGNSLFSGSGTTTKQGMYVVTRYYDHTRYLESVDPLDPEVRTYYFYIDRQGIVSKINENIIGSDISIKMGTSIDESKDESYFGGESFLQDLSANEKYILTTNKQPIELVIPKTKYNIEGVSFENVAYDFDGTNYVKTSQKLFLLKDTDRKFENGSFVLTVTTDSSSVSHNGNYTLSGQTINLDYGSASTTNLPTAFELVFDENVTSVDIVDCTKIHLVATNNQNVADSDVYFEQIKQNTLSYSVSVDNTQFLAYGAYRLSGNFVADKTLATANTSTKTSGVFRVLISDISNNYSDNQYNKLSFAFNVDLHVPEAVFVDASGIEISSDGSASSTNSNKIKLKWNVYASNNHNANIDKNNIRVTTKQYSNGQIVSNSFNLGSKDVPNSYIDFSIEKLEQTTGTSKQYQIALKYLNASKYGEYSTVVKTINFDYDKPNFNYSILKSNDKFLSLLTSEQLANFDKIKDASGKATDINFENYAFLVDETWQLVQPTFADVLANNSFIANDILYFADNMEKLDGNDLDKAWFRQYDKSYNSTSATELQSVVPGDERFFDMSIPNYKFDQDLTNKDGDKIYSEYQFGKTRFEIGKYYEIIEKDIAGNYRVYTIYVASDDAKISFEPNTSEQDLIMSEPNKAYEINNNSNEVIRLTQIDQLGDNYQVTIQNLTTNSAVTTLTKTKGQNITTLINSAISNLFVQNESGNNIELTFFTQRGIYTINYRTPGKVNINFNTALNSLTFAVDKNAGSFVKTMEIYLNDILVYTLGDNDTNKPYTITKTSSNNKTVYNIKFVSDGTGKKLVFRYTDNFFVDAETTPLNQYSQFVILGIQNTNFDFDENDSSANMLIFGQNSDFPTASTNKLVESHNNHKETIYVDENGDHLVDDEQQNYINFAKSATFYTGSTKVSFRYQAKVYSGIKIYTYKDDTLTELKNLYSNIDAETYIRTIQIYNNKNTNVDEIYVVQFQDPIGQRYQYVIHHYTKLAKVEFLNDNGEALAFGSSLVETKEKQTLLVTEQPEEFATKISATRLYVDDNGTTMTEYISDIGSGYSFIKNGVYTIIATNGIGTVNQFVFSYVASSSAIFTITATTTDGITKALVPTKNNKYSDNNGQLIDQYFTLSTNKVEIKVANGYTLTKESEGTGLAKTTIYRIDGKNNTYSKSFAVTQVPASTDLLLGKMTIDEIPVSSKSQNAQSTKQNVAVTLPNYAGIKGNTLLVKCSFNGKDLGYIDGVTSEDGSKRTYNFTVAGEYVLSIYDQAGNVHLFNGTTPKFTLLVLNNVTYKVNGQEPIQNAYYNSAVDLTVTNITKFYADEEQPYVTETVMINNKFVDTSRYSKTKNSTTYSYRFSEYGSYVVTFTAYVGGVEEKNKITTVASFTIINQNESRKLHEYIGLNGYEIVSIVKDNTDITNSIKQYQGASSLSQFAIFGGTGSDVVGGNGRYTITVNAYLGNLVGYGLFSYNVWINDDANAIIESSIAPGSATTKTIYLKMNLYQIYSEVGECFVKLNGETFITINESSASQDQISTYQLTSNKAYNVTVETKSGNTILSFVVTKNEPLNTIAIIVIVVVVVVVTAVVVTFILFRKKMRVR